MRVGIGSRLTWEAMSRSTKGLADRVAAWRGIRLTWEATLLPVDGGIIDHALNPATISPSGDPCWPGSRRSSGGVTVYMLALSSCVGSSGGLSIRGLPVRGPSVRRRGPSPNRSPEGGRLRGLISEDVCL